MKTSNLSLRTDVYGSITPENLRGCLIGKVALVTGSSRGIGKHIAKALFDAGASVAITGRDESALEATCREISADSGKCAWFMAEVLDDRAMAKLATNVENRFGPVDILVLSAGTNTFMPFHLHDAESWWHMMELNVRAPVSLVRHILPSMRKRNSGTIIFVSSRAALADLPWTTAYNSSKAALLRYAGSLAAELEILQKNEGGFVANGIEIFSIHPGEIKTDLHRTSRPESLKEDAPYVLELLEQLEANRPKFEPRLPAWSTVFLAAGRAHELRGQFIDCTRDIEEAINTAKDREA